MNIHISDALNEMNSRDNFNNKVPFSLGFFTHHQRSGEGGLLIDQQNVVTCGAKGNMNDGEMINLESVVNLSHKTRVHIPLIVAFNGKKITR